MNSTDLINVWPAPLIRLLEQQHALVERLVSLARSQGGLIAHRNTDRLMELLAQRQAIIDQFTRSQQELTEMTGRLDQRLAGVGPAQRERIRSLITEIGERLGEIMQRDQEDQASLRGHRDQTRDELHGVGAVRAARSAYHPSPSAPANRFADQKG